MRRILIAAVAALGLLAPVAAHADGYNFRGGCGFVVANDTTPGGQLGGDDVWNGVVFMVVIATDDSENKLPAPTVPITASCELRVNGVSQGTVLTASSPIGVAAAAGLLQFTAAVTDVVELCTHVKLDGQAEIVRCQDATETQVIPQAVLDLVGLVFNTVGDVVCQFAESPCNLLDQLRHLLGVYVMYVIPDIT